MKRSIVVLALLFASALCVAASDPPSDHSSAQNQSKADKSTAKKKLTKTAAAKTPARQPLTIPKDAVANPDGTYSYTDKKGEKWIFSKTPFGISRIQDMGTRDAAEAARKRRQFVTATDNGDTVKFVRQTPFGPSQWEKRKSDLNDDERQILEAQQPKPQTTDAKP